MQLLPQHTLPVSMQEQTQPSPAVTMILLQIHLCLCKVIIFNSCLNMRISRTENSHKHVCFPPFFLPWLILKCSNVTCRSPPGYAPGTPFKMSCSPNTGTVPPYSSSPNPYPAAVYPVRSTYPQQNPYAQVGAWIIISFGQRGLSSHWTVTSLINLFTCLSRH